MPWINSAPCWSEEPADSHNTFEARLLARDLPPRKMQPNPRGTSGSQDELRATQARLYRLLVDAQERLRRERGLAPTMPAEPPRTNGEADGSGTSGDKPKTNGESDTSGSSGNQTRDGGA
jgi:hypothetical protein